MLHLVLRNKIPYSVVRLNYDMKTLIDEPAIDKIVRSHVKKIRLAHSQRNRIDELEARAKTYINEGQRYIEWMKGQVKEINAPKMPPKEFLGQWRSIEFEVIFKSQAALDEFSALVRAKSLIKNVQIVDDHSLRFDKPGEVCKEICLNYRSGNENMVRELCSILAGRAFVNNSCGTHVHFDFRHATGEEADIYGKRIGRCVPALRNLLPFSRRSNKHCLSPINVRKAQVQHLDPERYAFVNMMAYVKHGTIEIRGHAGTMNAEKILNWIKVCEILMATDTSKKDVAAYKKDIMTVDALLEQYEWPAELREYILNRAKTFATTTVEEGEHTITPQVVPPFGSNFKKMANPWRDPTEQIKNARSGKRKKGKKKNVPANAPINALPAVPPAVEIPQAVV